MELQQYMALLMTINMDDVMEASLLRRNQDLPPSDKRRPPSWAREMGPQKPQALLPNRKRILVS